VRSEDGFTLIEVMVALLLLTVGIFAVVTTFDFSRASTDQSELQTAAVDRAQREVEAIRSLPYAQVAHPLGGIVAASGDDADPVARVSGTSFAWDRSNGVSSEALVISADGAVPMKQTIPRDDGDRFGYTIWRFVTATDEPGCAALDCPEGGGYKRVTVVVRANGLGDTLAPVWTSTTVIDPAAAANNDGTPQTLCQNPETGQLERCNNQAEGMDLEFYLTNTRANSGDVRLPLPVDPAQRTLHRTVRIPSTCKPSSAQGCPVPDLMVTDQLVQFGETDPDTPLSLATDVVPPVESGRPLLRNVACEVTPTNDDDLAGAYWVTPPLAEPTVLLGAGGLHLYGHAWAATERDITLCGAIYEAPGAVGNHAATQPLSIGPIETEASWPATLQPVGLNFSLPVGDHGHEIAAGKRIGLRLWVASGAPDDLVLVYDDPQNQSKLTLSVEKDEES
jgi:prepilin-type N-terminal cleavage/methylation domain-containing protein